MYYQIQTDDPEQIPDHVDPASVGLPRATDEPVHLEALDPADAAREAFEHGDLIERQTETLRY